MKEVKTTNGYTFTVDNEDFNRVISYSWRVHLTDRGKIRTIHGNKTSIGRFLLSPPTDKVVDHIDRNVLNNCKSNLRICTHVENSFNKGKYCNNKSGYKCIYWDKPRKKWRAAIKYKGKKVAQKRSNSIEELRQWYNDNAPKYHGKFASFI